MKLYQFYIVPGYEIWREAKLFARLIYQNGLFVSHQNVEINTVHTGLRKDLYVEAS